MRINGLTGQEFYIAANVMITSGKRKVTEHSRLKLCAKVLTTYS